MALPTPSEADQPVSQLEVPPGQKLPRRRARLTTLVIASYLVYAVFGLLVLVAVWVWWKYLQGQFTPADTALLAAEATLLLAAAAILVIVFEIEKIAKAKSRPPRTRTGSERAKKPKAG